MCTVVIHALGNRFAISSLYLMDIFIKGNDEYMQLPGFLRHSYIQYLRRSLHSNTSAHPSNGRIRHVLSV